MEKGGILNGSQGKAMLSVLPGVLCLEHRKRLLLERLADLKGLLCGYVCGILLGKYYCR